ncbi:hypothetical protein GQ54DRAFT_297402 [Martensiomyces pterosporus]|nr:hypothetical protein GQ54DRAFT_297402 [Martensiomyces pterosporus]
MTTATTLTNPLHSLRLFSSPNSSSAQRCGNGTPALSTTASSITTTASSSSSSGSKATGRRPTEHPRQSRRLATGNDSGAAGAANTEREEELWPAAVDTLAQRLWECGRIALTGVGSGNGGSFTPSSKVLVDDRDATTSVVCDTAEDTGNGDEEGEGEAPALCDGPYVRVDFAPVKVPSPVGLSERSAKKINSSSAASAAAGSEQGDAARRQQSQKQPLPAPFHHYQPITNPFKSLLRPSSTPPQAASPPEHPTLLRTPTAGTPAALATAAGTCAHCRRGSFLEFCFSKDRCQCLCHNDCPCKPCGEIRCYRDSGSTPSQECGSEHRPAAEDAKRHSGDLIVSAPSTRAGKSAVDRDAATKAAAVVDNVSAAAGGFRPFGAVDALCPVAADFASRSNAGRKRNQREYAHARMRVSKVWADEKRRLCSLPT